VVQNVERDKEKQNGGGKFIPEIVGASNAKVRPLEVECVSWSCRRCLRSKIIRKSGIYSKVCQCLEVENLRYVIVRL